MKNFFFYFLPHSLSYSISSLSSFSSSFLLIISNFFSHSFLSPFSPSTTFIISSQLFSPSHPTQFFHTCFQFSFFYLHILHSLSFSPSLYLPSLISFSNLYLATLSHLFFLYSFFKYPATPSSFILPYHMLSQLPYLFPSFLSLHLFFFLSYFLQLFFLFYPFISSNSYSLISKKLYLSHFLT